MAFFLISNQGNSEINRQLEQAASERSLAFHLLDIDRIRWTTLPRLQDGDLLYRAAIGSKAVAIESLLFHAGVATLYPRMDNALRHLYSPTHLAHAGIPVPKTIGVVNREWLDDAISAVGGTPIIVKVLGGSHGVGVMRFDSRESLVSVLDYLDASKQHYVMQQCIRTRESFRLVVLGYAVVGANLYRTPHGDFRSNVGARPDVAPYQPAKDLQEIAVRAVHTLQLEFGGVDIITDERGCYVTEVNFPCNFSRTVHATGIDIAGQMIDYLLRKSRRLISEPRKSDERNECHE